MSAYADEVLAELTRGRRAHSGPRRDLFPLPRVADNFGFVLSAEASSRRRSTLVKMANATVASLNSLFMGGGGDFPAAPPTGAQLASLESIFKKTSRTLRRFDMHVNLESSADAYHALLKETRDEGGAPQPRHSRIDPARIDQLPSAGDVDPADILGTDYENAVGDSSQVFGSTREDLRFFGSIDEADRGSYATLSVKELRSHKVELCRGVSGGGQIFCVPKSDTDKVREVWNGTRVSEAARDPPAPPHLADPEAFAACKVPRGSQVLMGKRDCRALFDQLLAPPTMRPFFGRPSLTVADLTGAGMKLSEIAACCVDSGPLRPDTRLFLRSRVWPMGLSWSSWVAQSTMLSVVREAGFGEGDMLAPDLPAPPPEHDCHALATDDFMFLTTRGRAHCEQELRRFDRAAERRSLKLNDRKSITAQDTGVMIGLLLDQGRFVAPSPQKHWRLLLAVFHLVSGAQAGEIAPFDLLAILGVYNWFARLNRPLFGAVTHCYSFARQDCPRTPQPLPMTVKRELLAAIALLSLAEVDFTADWHPELIATDASAAFGFGVAVAPLSPQCAESLGRHALTKRLVVDLAREAGEEAIPRKPRKGVRLHLPVSRRRFRVVLSQRARFQAHSGGLELHGAQLAIERLARDGGVRGRRVIMLMDAISPMCAIVKGRSNKPTLLRGTQRVDALLMATDLRLNLFYIPSEINPGDPPSRGLRLHPERAAAREHPLPELEQGWEERVAELAGEFRAILA